MKKIVILEKFEVRKSAWETGEKISYGKKFLLENRCEKWIVVEKIGVKFGSQKIRKINITNEEIVNGKIDI